MAGSTALHLLCATAALPQARAATDELLAGKRCNACFLRIFQCPRYGVIPQKGRWFDDADYGGPASNITKSGCKARAESFKQSCGPQSTVQRRHVDRCRQAAHDPSTRVPARKLLFFDTCGGFTNQRIAIVMGLLIADASGRAAVLPEFLNANGVQRAADGYKESSEHLIPFDRFYDPEATADALRQLGLQVATREEVEQAETSEGREIELHTKLKQEPMFRYKQQLSGDEQVARLDCPFFAVAKLTPGSQFERQYFSIDQALVPSTDVAASVKHTLDALRERSLARGAGGAFNALHVRAESDWIDHCKVWETHDGDNPRDNCNTNIDKLEQVFAIEGVPTAPPLFVAGELYASSLDQTQALTPLRRGTAAVDQSARYDLFTKDMASPLSYSYSSGRDLLAAVDYHICMRARTFAGNSVSSFTAHLLLWRAYAQQGDASSDMLFGKGDFHYNAGGIPLAGVMYTAKEAVAAPPRVSPYLASRITANELRCYDERYPDLAFLGHELHRLQDHWLGFGRFEGRKMGCSKAVEEVCGGTPSKKAARGPRSLKWVFTATGMTDSYNSMIQVAVRSAFQRTSLVPVCIFYGNRNAVMARWLERQGVRMVYHTPKWREQVVQGVAAAQQLGHQTKGSVLFEDVEMEVATFLRVDLGTLGFVDEYILYADVDVLFMSDITIDDFGATRPRYFTMGSELYGDGISTQDPSLGRENATQLAGNAGVMLVNVDGMRRTHDSFVQWIFSAENMRDGLAFGVYGPADQGALNRFYRGKFDVMSWPLVNWKPYWGYCAAAKLVHFHGPKPSHYVAYQNDPHHSRVPNLLMGLVQKCVAGGMMDRDSYQDTKPGTPIDKLEGYGCFRYVNAWRRWNTTNLGGSNRARGKKHL